MAYKVLTYFEDLQDNGHPYHPGEEYPRSGLKVTEARLSELSGDKNLRGVRLIEKKSEPKKAAPKRRTKKAE